MPAEIPRPRPLPPDDYDAVAYPGFAYPDTHPDRLAVMGLLHGLDPAPVDRCRVLDIGCNDAANIIPMAYAMPGSEFVGFDLAAQPIARARRRIGALGLTNVRVFQRDLMESGEPLGTFDYIVAHGVYAWVPEPVRDRLLAFCRDHLASQGIAFISYNALPGGHLRNLVRDIALQGAGGVEDPVEGANRATEFLRFVIACRPDGDPFRALLEKEAKSIERKGAQVFHHDEMASGYRPVSFTEFASHAGRNGLQYLSEALLPPPNDPCFQPQVVRAAKALAKGDPIAEEQVYDFARMRMYRETLLCHADRAVDGDLRLDAFDRLRLASQAEAAPLGTGAGRLFTLPGGIRMESEDATTILLMEHLIEAWPRSIPLTQVGELLESHGIPFDGAALTLLLRLTVSRMVELHAWAPPIGDRVGQRPRASAITRQEAAAQTHVTTLLHTSIGLDDPTAQRLVLLLDGTRDRGELRRALAEESPEADGTPLAEEIGAGLRQLHRLGVLLAEDFGRPAAD